MSKFKTSTESNFGKVIAEEEVLQSNDNSTRDEGGLAKMFSSGIQDLSSHPASLSLVQAAPKKRRDRLGNVINVGVQHRWKITFRDMVQRGQPIATTHYVESYKEFNKIEDDPYADGGIEAHFRMLRRKDKDENETCNCAIF